MVEMLFSETIKNANIRKKFATKELQLSLQVRIFRPGGLQYAL